MIEELVVRVEAGDGAVLDTLADLAAADPVALSPYLARLLAAGARWRAETLYRGADRDFQQRLVELIEDGQNPGGHVYLLAQTRGPVVEAAFRRWSSQPPAGIDPYDRGIVALARDGGWELQDYGVRELSGPVAYRLVPEPGDGPGPVPGMCPWCGTRLWTILDVDTTVPEAGAALAHTGWSGRLRVGVCHVCSCYDTVYLSVAADGSCTWSDHTVRPGFLQTGPPEEPPQIRMAIGVRRPSPFQASAWDEGGSTLGGAPDSIQDPVYLACPGCELAMDYIGLVNGADVFDGEGACYLSLHTGCGLAAVTYQQS